MKTLIESGLRSSPNTLNRELTIDDLWKVFARRRAIILGTTLLALSTAIVASIYSHRQYKASATLQFQKESVDGLGLSTVLGDTPGTSDALDGNITIQTQAKILESDTLALRAIKDLNLESTEDFEPKFNPLLWAEEHLAAAGPRDPDHASLEDAPRRRTHASLVFSHNLRVEPIPGTRLIEITYFHSDPKIAAAVVNDLIQGLADYGFQTRYNATTEASGWLGGQLADLRKQSEDLQANVVKLQRESGMVTVGGGSELDDKAGRGTGLYSSVLDRLQQSTTALTQAESNRILKGAIYEAVKSGDAEMISGLAGNSNLMATNSGLNNSLTLIQSLRLQQASLQGQFDELSSKFGPAYPKLDEIHANLTALDQAIKAEVGRVAERAKNDFAVAQTIEDSARRVFDDQKRQAEQLSDKTNEYAIAREEADQSRNLYETLFSHLKEAGVLEGLRSSHFTIVDPARVPAKPARPRVLLYLVTAVGFGLFLGCGIALIVDVRDHKVRDFMALEAQTGHVTFGILPKYSVKKARINRSTLIALDDPGSPYVEALRVLRTWLLRSKAGMTPKVVLVTSSIASEGKTTLCLNLAITLALQGKKVLLIDADLRQPTLHKQLNMSTQVGLSSILTEQTDKQDLPGAIAIERLPTMRVLPSGPVPAYPSELLGSVQMRQSMQVWRDQFDMIILDAPPVLPVTDALILSEFADYTLMVARFNVTERESLERSYSLLQMEARPEQEIAVVMNAVKNQDKTQIGHYGYRGSMQKPVSEGRVA